MKIQDLFATKARTVKVAKNEKSEIQDLMVKLTKQITEIEKEIIGIEEEAETDVLNDLLTGTNEGTQKVSDISRLQNEIKVKKSALIKCEDLLIISQNNIWIAEASSKRKEAAQLRKEAGSRQLKTDELLAQLLDFEGVCFAPLPPSSPGSPVGNLVGGSPQIVIVPITKTQEMFNKAAQLEAEAGALERSATAGKKVKLHSLIGAIEQLKTA